MSTPTQTPAQVAAAEAVTIGQLNTELATANSQLATDASVIAQDSNSGLMQSVDAEVLLMQGITKAVHVPSGVSTDELVAWFTSLYTALPTGFAVNGVKIK